MTTILIISTLISVLISFSIWKIWKWFEYRAWIEPAEYEALLQAIQLIGNALLLASTAIGRLAISMQEAKAATDRMKLGIGGVVAPMAHIHSVEFVSSKERAKKYNPETGKPDGGESRINL